MGKGGTHGQGPSVNGSKGDYCTLSSIVNGASDDLDRPLDFKELNMDYLQGIYQLAENRDREVDQDETIEATHHEALNLYYFVKSNQFTAHMEQTLPDPLPFYHPFRYFQESIQLNFHQPIIHEL